MKQVAEAEFKKVTSAIRELDAAIAVVDREEAADLYPRLARAIKQLQTIRQNLRPIFTVTVDGLPYGNPHARVPGLTLRAKVLRRDKYLCRYCGNSTGEDAVIDHVEPYFLGGLTVESNLVTACQKCNMKKRGYTLAKVGMTLLPVPAEQKREERR